jgi:glycosyltransferase involved in cell wall biosynthesis
VRYPAVSIVIPTFNAESWLPETLRSIAAQTLDANLFEVIVVDNGSIDATVKTVKNTLQGCSFELSVVSEPLRGVSHARNRGIVLARGHWVQPLDSDDLLHPDKLRLQLHAARNLDQDIGVVYSSWQRAKRDARNVTPICPSITPWIDDGDVDSRVRSLLTTRGFIPTGSALLRRSALNAVGGYHPVGLIEDVDLYLRMAIGGWRFRKVESQTALFLYCARSGSLSSNSCLTFWDGVIRNAALAETWARAQTEAGSIPDQLADVISDCYFQGGRAFAGLDWKRFDAVVERLERLIQPVIPRGPPQLRILSKLLGYRRAERAAVAYRKIKGLLK